MDRIVLEGRNVRNPKALWGMEVGLRHLLHVGNKIKGMVKDDHPGQLRGSDCHQEVKQKRSKFAGPGVEGIQVEAPRRLWTTVVWGLV